jgi:hypothetical protein
VLGRRKGKMQNKMVIKKPIKLLFADFTSPEEHAAKEVAKFNGTSTNVVMIKRAWFDILIEQIINASIIAGIAACATNFDSWYVVAKAFGITFLVEMRKYRKI